GVARLIGDGVLVATPGRRCLQFIHLHGPVLPLGSHTIGTLTPLALSAATLARGRSSRPTRVRFRVLDPLQASSPSVTADSSETAMWSR
ncbi:hypothetical protein ACE0DR_25915, partial [Azotobacter sp. CWF10]